jgi:hypothetical protein
MKKIITLIGLFLLVWTCASWAAQKEAIPNLTWDGKDKAGAVEKSLPVTAKLYNAETNAVLSTAQINGPVVDFDMPGYTVEILDNTTVELSVYATLTDSAGNVSDVSDTITKTFTGSDTIGPSRLIIRFVD